jgi:hypothetical protein
MNEELSRALFVVRAGSIHARVRVDYCADIVAGCSARCALGHDVQVHAATHEFESAEERNLTQALVVEYAE